ncbi:MAG TPA: hypothetical protein VKX33_02770 [Cyclobacteriaceae bacterium]|nr:hypothetical protein [Cyclobacteriaceae bacterium]
MAIPTSLTDVDRLIREKPVAAKALTEKETTAQEETHLSERDHEQFDEFKFQDVLEQIILKFKEEHKNMEISVLRQPFKVMNDTVTFMLNGEMHKDIFAKIRPEITGMLRRALRNFKVDLTFEIKEDEENSAKRLYTSTDKLNYLREKSPALKELQNRFGLETDF